MSLKPRPGFNWQAVSWGGPDEPAAERIEPLDDDYGDEPTESDVPSLGPCCACERYTASVRNIVMLPWRNKVPGHGWGCFVCHLPCDGACAVLCDDCTEHMESGEDVIRFACRGFPGTDGRASIEDFTETFTHDLTVPH